MIATKNICLFISTYPLVAECIIGKYVGIKDFSNTPKVNTCFTDNKITLYDHVILVLKLGVYVN